MHRSSIQAIIAIFIVTLLFSSCDPAKRLQRKVKRAEKKITSLVRKYPELLKKDTVVVIDTTVLESIRTDSSFSINFDTVFVENERASVRLIRIKDTIYSELIAKQDTVIKTVEVVKDSVVVKKPTLWEEVKPWLWILLVIALLIIFKKKFYNFLFN